MGRPRKPVDDQPSGRAIERTRKRAREIVDQFVGDRDARKAGIETEKPWEVMGLTEGQWQFRIISIATSTRDIGLLDWIMDHPVEYKQTSKEEMKVKAAQAALRIAERDAETTEARKKITFEDLLNHNVHGWKVLWAEGRREYPKYCRFLHDLDEPAREFAQAVLYLRRADDSGRMDWPAVKRFHERYGMCRDYLSGATVPWVYNSIQTKHNALLEKLTIMDDPTGINIFKLKSRQQGSSLQETLNCILIQLTHPGFNAVDVAHKQDENKKGGALDTHYDMIDLFLSELPYPPERKVEDGSWKTGIAFTPRGVNGSFSFLSSAGKNVGSGGSRQILLWTEMALTQQGKFDETRTSMMGSFKKQRASYRVYESTFKFEEGSPEEARDMFLHARDYGITPVFYGWQDDDRKRLPTRCSNPKDFRLTDPLVIKYFEERPHLHFVHPKEDAERKNWFQSEFQQMAKRQLTLMMQEYPSSPEEVLDLGIDCFYDTQLIGQGLKHVRSPRRGHLEYETAEVNRDKAEMEKARFVEEPAGPVCVWYEPELDTQYVFGIDPCIGGGADQNGDYAVIYVFDRRQNRFCARYREKGLLENLHWRVFELRSYYRTALPAIVAPLNRNAQTFVRILAADETMAKYNYEIYKKETFDAQGTKISETLGYTESGNGVTSDRRLELYTALRIWMNDRLNDSAWHAIPDKLLYDECRTFVYKIGARPDHKKRADKNDCVSAASVAIVAHSAHEQFGSPEDLGLSDPRPKGKKDDSERGRFADLYEKIISGNNEEELPEYSGVNPY